MLAGEYAVLEGGRCLAVTVNQWLTASASSADTFSIHSDLWSQTYDLSTLSPQTIAAEPLLQAAQAARQLWFPHSGFALNIRSELDVAYGLGSSSAVRLASFLALQGLAESPETVDALRLGAMARELQLEQQSFASGYDLLVQSQGGLILWNPDYRQWPGSFQKQSCQGLDSWVHIYGGGRGAPTGNLGRLVRSWLAQDQRAGTLYTLSEALIDAYSEVLRNSWAQAHSGFMHALLAHRRFLSQAPGFPETLARQLSALPGCDQSWTFKTTGAGGEDAILLFGPAESLREADSLLRTLGWHQLTAGFTDQGAHWYPKEIL